MPFLFAKHEGFHDAAAAFPHARTVSVPEAPSVSSEFAEALRSFRLEIVGPVTGKTTSAESHHAS